jgi:hypothetical protein
VECACLVELKALRGMARLQENHAHIAVCGESERSTHCHRSLHTLNVYRRCGR